METGIYTIAFIIAMLSCFSFGMYVATQISDWINKKIK